MICSELKKVKDLSMNEIGSMPFSLLYLFGSLSSMQAFVRSITFSFRISQAH